MPLNDKQKELSNSMIRVNQAGEYGAKQIYAGQLAIMGNRTTASRSIAHMAEQEERHLEFFNDMIAKRAVRPTILQPLWEKAGFALGAVTAAIGPEAAMACTVAVETEIDNHYQEQLDQLGDSDPQLSEKIEEFRQEELEHKETALNAGAQQAPAYPLMSVAIRLGCKLAIGLSKKI